MVKKSKKSKSKRVPLRKKYKIIRKVKEHHKKKAKEAKKLGLNHNHKVEKDLGIPNNWPFKEQELKALEAHRARAIEELEQKKAARKEKAEKTKFGLLEHDGAGGLTSVSAAEDIVDKSNGLKIIASNKHHDLVPWEAVEKWLKYLGEELPAVAFKCSMQEQRSN